MQKTGIALLVLGGACAFAAGAAEPMVQADCHVGVGVSGVYGTSKHVHPSGFEITDTFDVTGRGVGAQFGCLKERRRWRYGMAVDLNDTSASGRQQEREPNSAFFAETAIEWLATLRLVGGYQVDSRTAVFVSGGLAASSMRARVCGSVCGVRSQKLWGLAAGGGFLYRFSSRWSFSAEYLGVAFENQAFAGPPPGFLDRGVNPEAHLVRVGLNLHF